jgi:hypothetical protein
VLQCQRFELFIVAHSDASRIPCFGTVVTYHLCQFEHLLAHGSDGLLDSRDSEVRRNE